MGETNEEMSPIPGWDELFMRHAYLMATKSKDKSSKIGAVMVRDGSIIAEGYNGLPRGVNDNKVYRDERPEKYFWYEHAERNTIYNCAKHGIATNGATLYFFATPCADCARAIIQSGIKEIVHHKQWDDVGFNKTDIRWKESTQRSLDLLNEGGVSIRWFDKKLGVKTLISGKVHEV